jgi:hypothetical protein
MIFFKSPRLTQSPSLVGFVELASGIKKNAGRFPVTIKNSPTIPADFLF